MKRSIKFSPETERDLKRLAIVMHDGNITATVSELIRTECRRKFGENYDIEATPEVATTPEVAPVIKKQNKATRGVVKAVKEDTTPAVAKTKREIPLDEVRPVGDAAEPVSEFSPKIKAALAEIPPQEVAPETVILDPIKEAQEAFAEPVVYDDPFGDEQEVVVPVDPPKPRFKVFDPQNPMGSRPDFATDNARYLVWQREKKEHADSLKVNLTGTRQA
jgi:hypothetical protein